MVNWRRRRDNGRAFIVRPRGGKSVSMSLNKLKDEPLSRDELKKVLRARHIEEDEIVPSDETGTNITIANMPILTTKIKPTADVFLTLFFTIRLSHPKI